MPLLILSAACRANPAEVQATGSEAQNTQSVVTVEATPSNTDITEATITKTVQTAQMEAFFEKNKRIMLALADLLIELDVFSEEQACYSEEINDPRFNEKFAEYLAIAQADFDPLSYWITIEARLTHGKRTISFYFELEDPDKWDSRKIVYMPDGYIRLTYPDPEIDAAVHASEVKLAENWYSSYI